MTTDNQPQGWTVQTLKEYVDDKFSMSDKATVAALAASDKSVQGAMISAKEAVIKAETATEKRFEGVNEFRQTLADQATRLMPRAEFQVAHTSIMDRLAATELKSVEYLSRVEHQAAHDAINEKIDGLTDRLNRYEGTARGSEVTMGKIYAAIAATGAILGILIALSKILL